MFGFWDLSLQHIQSRVAVSTSVDISTVEHNSKHTAPLEFSTGSLSTRSSVVEDSVYGCVSCVKDHSEKSFQIRLWLGATREHGSTSTSSYMVLCWEDRGWNNVTNGWLEEKSPYLIDYLETWLTGGLSLGKVLFNKQFKRAFADLKVPLAAIFIA